MEMAVMRGIVLGAANVLVIAIGMGVMAHDSEVTSLVATLGAMPGMIAGAVLGWLAQCVATRPPRLRVALLAVPAVGVVVALADTFGMDASVPVACIPTLVAVLILERWTRRVTPAPVPVATVMSTGS
jgi:hypothetical protein